MGDAEVAALQAELRALKDSIEQRIKQEDRIQREYWNTLKAQLGGQLEKIETMFRAHCEEDVMRRNRNSDDIRTVHGRIDEILAALSSRDSEIYEAPVERFGKIERKLEGTRAGVSRLDAKVALYVGYAVGGGSLLYTVVSLGLRLVEILK